MCFAFFFFALSLRARRLRLFVEAFHLLRIVSMHVDLVADVVTVRHLFRSLMQRLATGRVHASLSDLCQPSLSLVMLLENSETKAAG